MIWALGCSYFVYIWKSLYETVSFIKQKLCTGFSCGRMIKLPKCDLVEIDVP